PADDGVHPVLEQRVGLVDLADFEGLLGGDIEQLDQPDERDQEDRHRQQHFQQRKAWPGGATKFHRLTSGNFCDFTPPVSARTSTSIGRVPSRSSWIEQSSAAEPVGRNVTSVVHPPDDCGALPAKRNMISPGKVPSSTSGVG